LFVYQDDLLLDETKQFYIGVRLKIGQVQQEKEILNLFQKMIQKHVPPVVFFLQNIKPSVLEKIKSKKIKLEGNHLDFVHVLLKSGPLTEVTILNLLEEVQREKIKRKAQQCLTKVSNKFLKR
jgi:hypothetical protein